MAITKTERQIKFASANFISVTAGGNATSDVIAPADDEISTTVTFKADNSGVPVAGDTVDIYLMRTAGDPDADPDSADEYPDASHVELLCTLDTDASDPAVQTVTFNSMCEGYKIYAENNGASAITVSGSGHGWDME